MSIIFHLVEPLPDPSGVFRESHTGTHIHREVAHLDPSLPIQLLQQIHYAYEECLPELGKLTVSLFGEEGESTFKFVKEKLMLAITTWSNIQFIAL